MQMHVKVESLEIHFFLYIFGQQGNYCIFKRCCVVSVVFSTKLPLFGNFVFFSSNNILVFLKECTKLQFLHPPVFITIFSVYYVLINFFFLPCTNIEI